MTYMTDLMHATGRPASSVVDSVKRMARRVWKAMIAAQEARARRIVAEYTRTFDI